MVTANRLNWMTKSAISTVVAIGLGTFCSASSVSAQSVISSGNLVPVNVVPTTQPVNFTFTNVLEYSDCLSAILDLYQGNPPANLPTRQNACAPMIQQAAGSDGLSAAEARELLSAADFYSTNMLSRGLYPPKGLRLRIAEMLGFIYEIDQNDSEVLSRAAASHP